MDDDIRGRLDALGRAHVGDDDRPHELRTLPPDRYDEFRPVGEGGMGLIYWAIDTDLNREVAFKVIRAEPGDGSSTQAPKRPTELKPPLGGTEAGQSFRTSTQRFLQEAWITSGMAHPGIVPVYELGQTPEGIPYYTMRFIRGERTLGTAIQEASGKHLDERLALLEPFLKVCDTLRYAHARGVIHRDLKPNNIALGDFGEVVLLDWGLAKLKGAADPDDEDRMQTHIRAYREAADMRTVASGLGTPGYMAPEAALGQSDAMDESSDVYSLGALLFEILTGRLPFEFSTYGELASMLLKEEPPRARDIDSLVPEALSDLCAACLARVKDDRPRNADEVATAIRVWQVERERDREVSDLLRDAEAALAAAEESSGAARVRHLDRAVAAYGRIFVRRPGHERALSLQESVKRLRERGMREREQEARRRLLKRVAVAALVALTAITILVAVLVQGKRKEAEQARLRETAQRARAEDLAMFMLDDLRKELAPVGRLDVLKQVAEKAIAYYESIPHASWTDADRRARGLGLSNIGDALIAAGEYATAEKVLLEARGIFDTLLRERGADRDWQRDLSIVLNLLGDVRQERGDLPGAQALYEAALSIRRALLGAAEGVPSVIDDLARTLDRVGNAHSRQGDRAAAMVFYEEAHALRRRLVEADPEDDVAQTALANSLQVIGDLQSHTGKLPQARVSFEAALQIRERLYARDPTSVHRQEDLASVSFRVGHVHQVSGAVVPALEHFERSLRIYRRLGTLDPSHAWWQRNIALTLERLAGMALGDGDLETARRNYEEALDITARVVQRDPSSVRARHDHVSALLNVGALALRAGEHETAIERYRRALELAAAIVAEDPDNTEWLDDLATAHGSLARGLAAQGEEREAESEYRKSVEASRRLIAMDPDNADYLRNLAIHLRELADSLRDAGDLPGGRSLYEEARDLRLDLVERDPERVKWRQEYVLVLNRIGDVADRLGDEQAYLATHLEALQANRHVVEKRPHDGESLRELAFSLYQVGVAYADSDRLPEALSILREGVSVHRDAATRAPHYAKEHRLWRDAYHRVVSSLGLEGLETSGDHLAYAYLRHRKQDYSQATAGYEIALEDPEIRDNLQLGHLYNAACAASLGGRASLALEWLGLDVRLRRELLADIEARLERRVPADEAARLTASRDALLAHFEHARLQDPDLASLRDLDEFQALFE